MGPGMRLGLHLILAWIPAFAGMTGTGGWMRALVGLVRSGQEW